MRWFWFLTLTACYPDVGTPMSGPGAGPLCGCGADTETVKEVRCYISPPNASECVVTPLKGKETIFIARYGVNFIDGGRPLHGDNP
jgi:hypothetical protein